MFVSIAWLLLTLFDGFHTEKMLRKYGTEIEMNSVIKALAPQFGLRASIWFSILVPTAILLIGGAFFPTFLAVLLPLRGLLFGLQLAMYRTHECHPKKTVNYSQTSTLILGN